MVFKKLNANGQLVAACGTLMSKNPVPLKLQKPLVCNRSAKLVCTSDSSRYFIKSNNRIGGTYKKALFIEYTDDTFITPKNRTEDEIHLGSLGPVVRGEVGDTIEVVFRNKVSLTSASRINRRVISST